MKFLSVCSGIESASVAWAPLGFEAVAFSEVDKFPNAVLAHHYPSIPNLGDMLKFKEWPDYEFDILVGGTPCQSFSVAGLRKGLADPRGNLMLTYLAIADRYKPEWIVWENVPGVLSSGGGRDFGTFLGALAALGYGWAYRVLDAQFFGVPQRRRRVFVVGHLGNWQRAASVLFERHSLQRHSPPSREKRESIAPTISARTKGGGGLGTDFDCDGGLVHCPDIAHATTTHMAKGGDPTTDNYVAHFLRAAGFDASEDGTGRRTPLVSVFDPNQITNKTNCSVPTPELCHTLPGTANAPIAFQSKASSHQSMNPNTISLALEVGKSDGVAVAFAHYQDSQFGCKEYATAAIRSGRIPEHSMILRPAMQVRRLTPRECERLQGFSDLYLTQVTWRGKSPPPDGPMYKALGNSMAVPVMRWIGERIQLVDWLYDGVKE